MSEQHDFVIGSERDRRQGAIPAHAIAAFARG